MPKYVIVAFRYDSAPSLLYKTIYTENAVARNVLEALEVWKADIISIRRIYEKCPENVAKEKLVVPPPL